MSSSLGYSINKTLPLLDAPQKIKSEAEILERLLCLHVAAACAYGLDREKAEKWINLENIGPVLASQELNFIFKDVGDGNGFKFQIEGMWALFWSLSLTSSLNFSMNCDSRFATFLPNLKICERSFNIKKMMKIRSTEEIFQMFDFSYCLHWSVQQNEILNKRVRSAIQPYVITERRRALQWIFDEEDWYDLSLDT